jgi:prephenate dehydratase
LSKNVVYFLGEQFSFHHLAARSYFGADQTYISCPSFNAIVDACNGQDTHFGIIAVENTLAGDVPGNFETICNSGLTICGEIILPIQLQLAAKQQLAIDDIKAIYSHTMAIRETTTFFEAYPEIEFIETPSTSGAVKLVATSLKQNIAAIGNKTAINHYNLQIIAENIDNHASNFTRFLILSKKKGEIDTTFLTFKASLHLQPSALDLFKVSAGLPEIALLRHLKTGNVYIETGELLPQQLINIADFEQQNPAISSILGIYPLGKTANLV